MSYVVCQKCKRFTQVNPNAPMNFNKCQNCGHTLKFAKNQTELNLLLNGIEMPEVAYEKVCRTCKSTNPREVGACMYCGSTDFTMQYDQESLNKYNQNMKKVRNMVSTNPEMAKEAFPDMNIPISGQNMEIKLNSSQKLIYTMISVIMGFIDFMFFAMVGLFLVIGDKPIPQTTEALMPFMMQNITSIAIVSIVALILAGLCSIMIFPPMKYKSAFKTSAITGLVIGLSTLTTGYGIAICLGSMIMASIITGIGGIIGEFCIRKLTKILNNQ